MRIAVAGVGYVGLSLAVLLAQHNQVKAVDIIPEKADIVNKGKSPIQDTELEDYLANRINLGENYIPGLYATVDAIKAYKDAEIVIVAATTNYDIVEECFDTSAVENVIETVLSANKDALIVIKSTVPVGFTDSVRERFKTKNIIFSPEFLRESHALYDNLHPSRIIVGVDEKDELLTDRAQIFAELLQEGAIKEDNHRLSSKFGVECKLKALFFKASSDFGLVQI